MTKEELENEAEEYANTVKCEWENDTYWVDCRDKVTDAYLAGAEPREKRIAELEQQVEQFQKMYNEQKETLKKVRVALIKERTANIMNYGKGGVEMFDNMFEILKGVSN